ncbi:hypothetical protein [Corallococcus exercitus]|uniref:hypothetical protein n=1 Tax=Corallococcus exercitus TaxID=2316736 RepID=UPI0035D52770
MSEGYVLDTNALLFYAGDQFQKLGPTAKRAFSAFEHGRGYLVVPAPVVARPDHLRALRAMAFSYAA